MVNFRTLDLNLLRVFDAVMAEGSLTRAAAVLALTQPAVSHALRRLRQAAGDELFVRAAGGVRPTARAQQLWPPVRQALAALQHALAPRAFDPRRDALQARLALSDTLAAVLAPPLVAAIERDALCVDVRLLPLEGPDPLPLLEAGRADAAVGHFPDGIAAAAAAPAPDAPLRQERLYTTRWVAAMPRTHPLARGPLTLARFCAAHHLAVSFSGRADAPVDAALAALGRQRRMVLTVNQYATARHVLAAGPPLVAVLPETVVADGQTHDALAVRDLPLVLPPLTVDLCWHLRSDTDPAQQWLRQAVRDAAAQATAAIASATRGTLAAVRPVRHSRPERTR